MIIIINGASGAGKTFLLENLYKIKEYDFCPIKKYTTRYPRNFEKGFEPIDLVYGCKTDQIKEMDYNYSINDKHYGIDKKEIETLLKENKIPVVIMRSFEIIKKIKEDFEDVFLFYVVGATGETLKNKLVEQGRSQKEIQSSNSAFRIMIDDYMNNVSCIDYYIFNSLYDPDLYLKQFSTFIKKIQI